MSKTITCTTCNGAKKLKSVTNIQGFIICPTCKGNGIIYNPNYISDVIQLEIDSKQDTLRSGDNISTINYKSIIEEGQSNIDTPFQSPTAFSTDVLKVPLTGVVFTSSTAIVSTDTVLVAFGKLQAQITATPTQIQSDWTQATNTAVDYIKNKPTLGTAAAKNIPTTGDASATEVVYGTDTRLTNSRNAADVSAWAKAATKPSYTLSEVGGGTWGALAYPTWSSGTPFVKMTAAGTFSLDTNSYAQTNQSFYLGTTSIAINRTSGALALTGISSITPSVDSTTAFQILKKSDSSVIFNLDSTNGRVGIGTVSPIAKLQISPVTTLSGTSSINGTITVTGINTLYISEINKGESVTINGEIRTVANISNDTSFTVSVAFSTTASGKIATITNNSYSYTTGGFSRFYSANAMTTEINTNSNGSYGLRSNNPIKGDNFYLFTTTGGFYTYAGVAMFYSNASSQFACGHTSPTSYFHLRAGTATAGTSPFKLTTSGTGIKELNSVAEKGAMEFSDYGLWFTPATVRHKIWEGLIGQTAPSTSVLTAFINYYGTGGTVALSNPNTWISITGDDGNVYKVPAYS